MLDTICVQFFQDYFLQAIIVYLGLLLLVRFGFILFYDISIIVGNLMQNPLYTYILNIYDL